MFRTIEEASYSESKITIALLYTQMPITIALLYTHMPITIALLYTQMPITIALLYTEAEILWVTLNLHPKLSWLAGVCYRPAKDEQFMLNKMCSSINKINSDNCVLLDELDFRQINWSTITYSSQLEDQFIDTVTDNQFIDTITEGGEDLFLTYSIK